MSAALVVFPTILPVICYAVFFHDGRLPDRFIFLESNARLLCKCKRSLQVACLPKLMYNFVVIVVAGYWATWELCKNINFAMETKAKKIKLPFVILRTKSRLSLGQISELLWSRKEVIAMLNWSGRILGNIKYLMWNKWNNSFWTAVFFQASFQLLKLENSLRWSFFTLIKYLILLQTRTRLQRYSGLSCLEIRSRNEEAINSTRNMIYSLKVSYFLLYRRRYFLFLNWFSTRGNGDQNTSAVAGYTRIQLFRGFDSYSRQEQCIDHIPYYLSGLSRAHFFRPPFSK